MFNLTRPSFRELLRGGRGVGMAWLTMGSLPMVEMAVRAGADAIGLDAQHGLWDRLSIEQAIGAVGGAIPVLVRVAENGAVPIGQALDAGADGVIVPLVESAEEAAQAVAYAHFPPRGIRSGGGVRPLTMGFADYVAAANARVAVGVMIETAAGVTQAEAIARTPGVDFVFIGTGDLALSLGTFPNPDPRHEEACARVLAACRAAQVPCGLYTASAEAARARAEQGYALVTVATDADVAVQGFRDAVRRYRAGKETKGGEPMPSDILQRFAEALATGAVRVVDLTQTLQPSTPVIQLPPQFGPSNPFRMEEISHYDDRGPGWYWNNLSLGEHTGTHFDAPIHWVTGKDYRDGATDTIPPGRFVAPACVIDCSKEAAADEKFVLEPAHIKAWEERHGRIGEGCWVLMRTDWSKRTSPAAFLNAKEDGPHVPGPSAAAIRFLVEERDVNGWGVEAVGTDHGQAFGFEPAFPAHHLMHGANKLGLASLTNLDQLPPTGAVLITAPLKIKNGSGSPLRVLALIAN